MGNRSKIILSSLFLLVASVASSRITWIGFYQPKIPNSLAKK